MWTDLPSEKEHPMPIGGWVGPRAGLDAVAKRKMSVSFEGIAYIQSK
jgi:hypothetical protein